MFKFTKQQYLFIIISAFVLFFTNNILLGSIIPRMPGGSALGITTIFCITLVSLVIKRFGCISITYFVYGLIGLISHLLIGDWMYLIIILTILLPALLFDLILFKIKYRLAGYVSAFPFFVFIMQAASTALKYLNDGQPIVLDTKSIFISIIIGYTAIALASLSYKKIRDKKLIIDLS